VNSEFLDCEFASAGGALVLTNQPGDFDRRFLAQMIGFGERVRPDVGARRDTLADAGSVADQQKVNLAARAPIVKPPLDCARAASSCLAEIPRRARDNSRAVALLLPYPMAGMLAH